MISGKSKLISQQLSLVNHATNNKTVEESNHNE